MQLSRRSCSQLKFHGSHARVICMLITCACDINHMHRKTGVCTILAPWLEDLGEVFQLRSSDWVGLRLRKQS